MKQHAKSAFWVHMVFATLVAAFALIFIPFAYTEPFNWFVALWLISYVFIHWGSGIRSWIDVDKQDNYLFSMRGTDSSVRSYIAFDDIKSMDLCQYRLFNNQKLHVSDVDSNDHRLSLLSR